MKQRIRETISESENSEDEGSVNKTNPLDKFAEDHPTYRRIHIEEDFSDSDEFSLIKIPKGQDPNIFLNQRLRLDSYSKVKIDNMRIKTTPEVDQPKRFLLLAKNARIVKPLAYLISEIELKVSDESDLHPVGYHVNGNSAVKSPKKISESKHIEEKPKEDRLFQMLNEIDTSKSHKKRLSVTNSTVLPNNQPSSFDPEISQIKEEVIPKSEIKSKKRKRKSETEMEFENLSTTHVPKKKKKKKDCSVEKNSPI